MNPQKALHTSLCNNVPAIKRQEILMDIVEFNHNLTDSFALKKEKWSFRWVSARKT